MNRVRMILVVASVVVLVALAAVIFVLTRGDDASSPEPKVETVQTETPVPKDEPIVVVPKDTGQPAPPANETDKPKEDAIEEPPDEAEPPELPEEAALRQEVERQSTKAAEEVLREMLGMTVEQLEAVPDAVIDQFVAKIRPLVELQAACQKADLEEGVADPRVEELKRQMRSKPEATLIECLSDAMEAIELMRPYLNGEQRLKLNEILGTFERLRQKALAGSSE